MAAKFDLTLRATLTESATGLGAGADKTAVLTHLLDHRFSRASGTSSGQQDIVWSDRLSITTTPTDLDPNALTSQLNGATLNMARITFLALYNGGSANLLLGGATNSIAIFSDDSDIAIIPPGGFWFWDGGADGVVVGASDVIRLDAASGTLAVDVWTAGRSA